MRHLLDVDICVKACLSLCVREIFSLRFADKFHHTLSKLSKISSIGKVRLSEANDERNRKYKGKGSAFDFIVNVESLEKVHRNIKVRGALNLSLFSRDREA